MPLQIEDILAHFERPIRSIPVCLRGDLRARHDELSQQLDDLHTQSKGKMGDSAEARILGEQIHDVEQQMQEAQVIFKFRGVNRFELEDLKKKYTVDGRLDVPAMSPDLLAACAVDPVMSGDQARKLLLAVDEGTAERLVGAAWVASTESADIPFYERASALIGDSGSK